MSPRSPAARSRASGLPRHERYQNQQVAGQEVADQDRDPTLLAETPGRLRMDASGQRPANDHFELRTAGGGSRHSGGELARPSPEAVRRIAQETVIEPGKSVATAIPPVNFILPGARFPGVPNPFSQSNRWLRAGPDVAVSVAVPQSPSIDTTMTGYLDAPRTSAMRDCAKT